MIIHESIDDITNTEPIQRRSSYASHVRGQDACGEEAQVLEAVGLCAFLVEVSAEQSRFLTNVIAETAKTHGTKDALLSMRVERLVAGDGGDEGAGCARVEFLGRGGLVGAHGIDVRQYGHEPAGGDGVELVWVNCCGKG